MLYDVGIDRTGIRFFRALLIGLLISGACAPAFAQRSDNPGAALGLGIFGAFMNQAQQQSQQAARQQQQQNAAAAWSAIDPNIVTCLQSQSRTSVQQMVNAGIGPNDSRVASYVASCTQQQNAAAAWATIDPNMLTCLQAQSHSSVQQMINAGVGPNDPRVASYATICRQQAAASAEQRRRQAAAFQAKQAADEAARAKQEREAQAAQQARKQEVASVESNMKNVAGDLIKKLEAAKQHNGTVLDFTTLDGGIICWANTWPRNCQTS